MSEMIERVARAIYGSKLLQPARSDDPWDGEPTATKTFCRDAARASIEAMREPTDEMIDAACCCERGNTVGDALRDEYRAMIDAALSTPNNDKT